MLFAFDLDQTLVTNDFRLPCRIAAGVRALRESGHLVTILTGRPLSSARRFVEELGITGPFSVNHGAQVMEASGGVLRHVRLQAADVRMIVEPWHAHPQVDFRLVVDDTLWVRDPSDARWQWVRSECRAVVHFDPALDLEADKVVFDSLRSSRTVDDHVARQLPHLERYLWGDGILEIVGPGADKGTALAYIAERVGVPQNEVVAFGDGLNDVSMLRWAGYAVAVGPQAHPHALGQADEHVAAPEDDGVTDWLQRNVLRSGALPRRSVNARRTTGFPNDCR